MQHSLLLCHYTQIKSDDYKIHYSIFLDWTEDPIFTRVQDRERKVHKKACEFDSSQESVEAIRGSSPNNSYNSVSVSGCTSGLNHSFLNNTTCQLSAVVDQQEHCLDERSVASHKATKDEHLSPSFPESSQVSGSTCTSVASLDNDSQKSEKIKNVESYTTAGCDSESLVSKKECAVQTTKTSTRDSSAQWSPVASVRDIGTSTEVPPTVLCCTNQLLSEVATQTDAPTEFTLDAPNNSCGRGAQHVVDTGVKDTTSAATVDKLRQEIATLERELSVAQSTLVWQSLMIRLHQL